MAKGKLIVLDGTDGSGKATQTALLLKNFKKRRIKTATLNIPVYNSFTGDLTARYLRGEFGRLSPYLASLLYAVNRLQFRDQIIQWLQQGRIVVLNRYVTANLIHQSPNVPGKANRKKFMKWVEDLEYGIFGLPKPDLVLFISVPPEIALKMIKTKSKQQRKYLAGAKHDMLESDLQYQREAFGQAVSIAKTNPEWVEVDGVEKGKLLSRQQISEKIWQITKSKLRV